MSFTFQLHFESEDDQPTMDQCQVLANLITELTENNPIFGNCTSAVLETPAPSDLDMSRVIKPN